MKKTEAKADKSIPQTYRRLMGYVVPYWRLFVVSIIGFGIYAATQPLFAALIKHIIDSLQTGSRDEAVYFPLMLVGLIICRGIGGFLGNYFLSRVSCNIVHTLRCEIFNHYTLLPTVYFDRHNSGYMISRITHNVGEVTRATTDSLRTIIREGLTAIGLLAYLVYTDWLLSLVFLVVAPVIMVLVKYVSKRLRSLSKNIQESVGDMTHITSELVNGHRIVRSFGGEEYERRRFQQSSAFNRKQSLKLSITVALQTPLMQIILSFALGGLMYLALIIMKQATAGEFVAYLTAAFLLPRPIRQLSDANGEIQRGLAAAETLFEVMDEPAEKDEGSYSVERCEGRLDFKEVEIRYARAEEPAIKDISFTVQAGRCVALVGSSGAGKSTLVNLIPRFYEYQKGQILLDGVEIKDYRLANLRKQIAMVTQNITLFNDTVANNIAYGVLGDAPRDKIIRAAQDAYAMEFIEKMPDGLDTEIGEHGINLSGGQRQRIALARALFKDAPVLILDEATSALDTASERYIQAALEKVMENRTTIVIAHRLSTIERADEILVMEGGRIVERGRHRELIDGEGPYARLYKMQFADVQQV